MSKKKTHEEYVAELAVKNPDIKVIGKYIGANIKIKHRCKIDNYIWEVTPHNILEGRCCPKCSGHIKRTHEEYVNEVSLINPNIQVLDKYINNNTPILHRCLIHNRKWNSTPGNILSGHGCKKCADELNAKIKSKSQEEYVKQLSIINPSIIVIGKYINAHTNVLHRCLIDNYEWYAKPNNILSGKGCPKCAGIIKKTHKQYEHELLSINPDIEILGEYINMKTPILHRCKVHNVKWTTSPDNILHGHGCYECLREKIANKNSKTNEQYIDDLKKINPYITPIEKYINTYTPILHKCLIDDNEWYARPGNVLSGTGCPQCYESKGERKIRLWLDRKHIEYKTQKKFNDCCDIKPLPFDFYLPTFNIAIEYQGKQHYEPIEYFGGQEKFELQQKHDKIKNEYCKNNGISLLRIPYYKNIEEELNNFLFI